MSEEENGAVARRFIEEVWNRGDVEAIDELVTNNFICHGPAPFEMRREGLAWLVQFLAMVRAEMGASLRQDIEAIQEIEAIAAEGSLVVVWTTGGVPTPAERYFPEEMLEQMRRKWAGAGVTILEQVPSMAVFIFRLVSARIAEQWIFTSWPYSFSHLATSEVPSSAERAGGSERRRKKSRR